MKVSNAQKLIRQAEYAKKLRPLLPAEAFIPDQVNYLFYQLIGQF